MGCGAMLTTADDETTAFVVGDVVVHPHHGAGCVVSRRARRVLGLPARHYLEIELAHCCMRISVPCDGARSVGLRAVIGARQLQAIAEVLEGAPDAISVSWSARQKHYRQKLKGGDVLELAAVIRDLALRDTVSGLPAGERELYRRARAVLVSELRYALGVDEDRAAAYIDEHVTMRLGGGRAA